MVLPLSLTLLRVVLGPVFLIFYLYYESLGIPLGFLPLILVSILLLSELSDLFDGYFARRNNQVTELGKLLDPMSDSIFRLTVFFSFTQGAVQLPVLLVLVYLYRDSVISTLRTLCALRGVALGARLTGKIKAVIQAVIAFFILVLFGFYAWGMLDLDQLRSMSFYSVLLGAIYTLISGIEYLYVNRKYIIKALST